MDAAYRFCKARPKRLGASISSLKTVDQTYAVLSGGFFAYYVSVGQFIHAGLIKNYLAESMH